MRLWVVCRHALALQRALLAKPGSDVVEHEQFLHTFLAIAATWKEAADAFRLADQRGCFNALSSELASQLSAAREGCNKSHSFSLYKRILYPLRHNLGAHFDLTKIQDGLASLSSESLPLRIGGATFFNSTFPLATALVEKILEDQGIKSADAKREFPNVINLGDTLQKITDAAVTVAVRRPNNSLQPTPLTGRG